MKKVAFLALAALLPLSAANRIYLNRIGPSAAELFIANADGSGEHKLFANSGFDYDASFSADGKWLWLSGRYDGVIYAFNTDDGSVKSITVGGMPHGLTVWPQPGRYSLGHTGNMR